MLGAWRAHGLDRRPARAWRRGVVLCGLSAGSLCWFAEALTAFHGAPRRVRGLGLLPYSNCVHYDAEPAAARGVPRASSATACAPATPPTTARRCTSSARELARVVSSRPRARAYRVEPDGDGEVVETPLDATYLGDARPSPALA